MTTISPLKDGRVPMPSTAYRTFYAIGQFPDESPVMAVFTPKHAHKGGGWWCRSTDASRMQFEYMRSETVHDVVRWIDVDLKYPYHLTMNREEVKEHLTTGRHWSNPRVVGSRPPRKTRAVERVLQHLECGW